jgi:dihydrofolate reductase
MRKLTVGAFLSIDGVVQGPGAPHEDESGGFTHGGWTVNYWDEIMGQVMAASMSSPFDMVLGRKTYDIFAAHWPNAGDDPAATALNNATKYVASRTRTSLEWVNSTLIEGNVADGVAKLRNQNGPDLQVHGSGNLLQTLMAHDLIDEYRLWVFPVVLGNGKRLFADGAVPRGLQLIDHVVSSTGVVMSTYQPAGELVTGSFALD